MRSGLPSILSRPAAWLAGVLILSLPFAIALGRLQIRTDGEALHPDGSEVIERTQRDRDRFHDPEAVIVLVAAPGAGGVLDRAGFAFIRDLTDRLRRVPGVRSEEVLSIANLPDVSASAGRIRLTRFLEILPASQREAEALRERLLADSLHRGLLYGVDGRSAAILVPLAPGAARVATVHRVRAALLAGADPRFEVNLTGPAVVEALLGEQILSDLARLVPLVVAVIAAVLWLCLGGGGAIAILTGMLAVLVWTFGTMSMLGVPLTLVTSVLPVLLMAMTVNDQIHLIERFQSHLAAGASRQRAIEAAFAEVGRAIVRTSLTTAFGFLAFTTTSVAPMRHFGGFAALGLLLALAFTHLLVPALLATLPAGWLAPRRRAHGPARGPERWAARRPGRAAFAAAALFLIALAGLPALRVQDSWVDNFDRESDLARAQRRFDRDYLGSYRVDATLRAAREGAFREPAGLALVDSVQRALAALPEVAGTRSVADLARSALRGVDSTRTLASLGEDGIAQLYLLIEMSGNQAALGRTVTDDRSTARITAHVRDADYARAERLLARVEALRGPLEGRGIELSVSGDLPVATEVVRATVSNQVRSVAFTLLGIGALVAVAFRSIPVALVLALPVAATTLIVLGGMGLAGVPLGVATSMFAALAEGEGIGFAIHIASRWFDLRPGRGARAALDETLGTVGPAVRWNALVVTSGCLVLCLSALRPVRALGALLAAGMAVSYLMAILVLPALLLRLRAPRRAPATVAALLAALAIGTAAASPARAAAAPAEDPEARRIMTEIERAQRGDDRLFSMEVTLTGPGGYTQRRRMLGVTRGDRRTTRILYVITSPAFFRGSTLLLHDPVDPRARDRTWFALPGLSALQELEAASLRFLVPGTGITYEESRGWIAPEKYRFSTRSRAAGETLVEARPASDSLVGLLGVSRLAIRVDPERRVVLGVTTYDPAGTLVRDYRVTDLVREGGRWHAARVETEHQLQQVETVITYRYAPLRESPPERLFRPEISKPGFLERLLAWTRRSGFDRQLPDSVEAR